MDIWGDGGQSGFNAANPDLRFNPFTGQANDANFRGGDPSKWVIITGDIVVQPGGLVLLCAGDRGSEPGQRGHDLPGLEQRLAHAGLGRRPGVPRGELLRVLRASSDTWRAVTSSGSGRPGTPASRANDAASTAAPTAAARTSPRSSGLGHRHDLGRHGRRPRLRLEERERGGRLGDVDADRQPGRDGRSGPVRLLDLRRPGEPEPRLDLVLGLQREHCRRSPATCSR